MWFNPAEITKPAGAPIATLATLATLQPEINKEQGKVAEVAEVAGWWNSKITFKPDPCNRCAHLSRFVGGNACRADNGLPVIFGLLHGIPDSLGVDCLRFKETSL